MFCLLYCLLLYFDGLSGAMGVFLVPYTLSVELVGSKYITLIGCIIQIPFAIGEAIDGLVAWPLDEWVAPGANGSPLRQTGRPHDTGSPPILGSLPPHNRFGNTLHHVLYTMWHGLGLGGWTSASCAGFQFETLVFENVGAENMMLSRNDLP